MSLEWMQYRPSFDNMQVLIFNEFGLKMPIHAPKMEVWGIVPHK